MKNQATSTFFAVENVCLNLRDGAIVVDPKRRKEDRIDLSNIKEGDIASHAVGEVIVTEQNGFCVVKLKAAAPAIFPEFKHQNIFLPQQSVSAELSLVGDAPWVAVYQHKEWWQRPAFGRTVKAIPARTQLLIRKAGEEYEVFLAVCGQNCRADMEGAGRRLKLSVSTNLSGLRSVEDIAMICGRGADPYALLEQMVQTALTLTGKHQKLRRNKTFPHLLEKWGWCTWDSLQRGVSEKGILEKMDDFKANNIHVPWVLIDDGWSEADHEAAKLSGFDADHIKFPRGLEATIKTLKEDYGVEYVGIWHPIKGYWNGIVEGSPVETECKPYLRKYPSGELMMDLTENSVFSFYNTWHKKLVGAGVEFIKVDSQSSIAFAAEGLITYTDAARALHRGLEASANLNFGGNLINCMGMAPENMWNRETSAINRSSDDNAPSIHGSFNEHAWQNAYNSIYAGNFTWCDWDMVWTIQSEKEKHVLLRAISGGPVYISDGVGKTDIDTLKPLMREDGSIMRCSDVGKPTLDCLLEPKVLKEKALHIYNRCGDHIYVAVFKGSAQKTTGGSIRLEQIPGADSSKSWLVYDHRTKKAVKYDRRRGFTYDLGDKETALFELIPVTGDWMVIGMTDHHISYAGIERVEKLSDRLVIVPNTSGELSLVSRTGAVKIKEQVTKGELVEFTLRKSR